MTACTAACRLAEGSDCHCAGCEGARHGELAAHQQLTLLAGLRAESPVLVPAVPEPPQEPPRPVEPVRRPRAARETGCVACGEPWHPKGEAVPFADIDGGLRCTDCAEALWKAAEAAEARRVAPVPTPRVPRPAARKGGKARVRTGRAR